MSWRTFLAAHWDGIPAADFFTVEVRTRVGLVRSIVLFVIDLPTGRVQIAGLAPVPDGMWMEQIARTLVDGLDGFLREKQFLIMDRDPLFTKRFREVLERAEITPVRLPPQSPNLNAYAERFVPSIKSECLSRLVLLGERHLRRAVEAYVEHDHDERRTRDWATWSWARRPTTPGPLRGRSPGVRDWEACGTAADAPRARVRRDGADRRRYDLIMKRTNGLQAACLCSKTGAPES